MKKLKNIFYFALLGIVGASCSDDFQSRQEDLNDDYLTLNLEIPDEVVVQTRAASANEGQINNLGVYIFNSDGSRLLQYSTVGVNKNAASVGLSATAKGQAKKVYLVANPTTGLSTNPASVTALEALTVAAVNGAVPSGASDYFVMSGSANVGANVSSTSVNLTRLAAKVAVTTTSVDSYIIEGFEIHNPATAANIGGPINKTFESNSNAVVSVSGAGETNPVYIYPTLSAKGSDTDKAFVIIKAKNAQGVTSYYRLNLSTSNTNVLNIESNHYIQIVITGVKADGYATAAEAAQHPEVQGSSMTAEIHDHASGVFSMISDGTRELGAPAEIQWIPSSLNATFTVKCYSHTDADMDTPVVVKQQTGQDWVTLNETPTKEETSSENNVGNDLDNPGHRYTYTLSLVDNKVPVWESVAEIKVTWLGLERNILVKFDTDFSPENILKTTKLSIGGTAINADYWDFIANKNNGAKLAGADVAAMGNGMDRSNGFHFPMQNDGKDYVYDLTFDKDKFNGNITGITATTTGDNDLSTAVKWTPNSDKSSGKLTYTKNETYKYSYSIGKITFKVSFTEGSVTRTANIEVPVYHTGFFWGSGNSWLYYEVVKLAGTGNSQYWLDRNIGATSRLNYVENSNGQLGVSGAKGSLVAVGKHGGKYESPTINDGTICPTGFHVPTKTEWDAVRTSSNFRTEQETLDNTTVYATYFISPDDKAGKIYFPKARFKNDGNDAGDDASGYYWSRTESLGLEKDQIGNWVNVLYLSGASNTWINGDVEKHAMSVRAVAGNASEAKETKTTLSFNVKGATHVYIYDGTPGNGLFTFPGKAICTAQTAKDNTVVNFSYTTTKPSTSTLKVYLVNVDNSGKITVYSDNGKSSAKEATGIDYKLGATYYVSGNKTVRQ